MKNVTLVRLPNGNRRLLDSDSIPIDAFTQFHNHMHKKLKLSEGTITLYDDNLARFLDYLIETKVFLSDVAPTRKDLDDAVSAYPDYLTNGFSSEDTYVVEIAKSIGFKGVQTDGHHIAAINHFLAFSEQLAKDMVELTELVTGIIINSPSLVFSALQGEVKISHNEINRIRQNSVLGANLRHIKPWRKARLPSKNKRKVKKVIDPNNGKSLLDQTEDIYVQGANMDFPIEQFQELLENEPCSRNRALWALLGGGGLRQSEGVITYTPLVFPEEQIVRIVDPNNWRGSTQYKVPHRFKGRETAKVYFIPVFRQIFFDSYLEWMKIRPLSEEYFVFLKYDRDGYGQPLHLATYATMNKAFKKAQKRIGMTTLYTLHSLRHMYGVFMVNYYPTPWKILPGLDEGSVQKLMGHACISSTQGYAKKDEKLLDARMELGERMLMGETHLSLPEMIVKSLRKQADAIEGKQAIANKEKQTKPIKKAL